MVDPAEEWSSAVLYGMHRPSNAAGPLATGSALAAAPAGPDKMNLMVNRDQIPLLLGIGAIVVTLAVGTCSTNARIGDLNDNINSRFDDLAGNMNNRFDDFTDNVNSRFDDLTGSMQPVRT